VLGVNDGSDLLDFLVAISSVSLGVGGIDDLAINNFKLVLSSGYPGGSLSISLFIFTNDSLIGLGFV